MMARFMYLFMVLCGLLGAVSRRCTRPEKLEVPECNIQQYNHTQMPNLLGHESQLTAKIEFRSYAQLLTIPCSSWIHFFLCSVYFPICDTRGNYLMEPCESMCELVKKECTPVLDKLNYKWPESLNCSRMPSEKRGDLCIHRPETKELPEAQKDPQYTSIETVPMDMFSHLDNETFSRLEEWIEWEKKKSPDSTQELVPGKEVVLLQSSLANCGQYKNTLAYVHINVTNSCVPLCESNVLFNRETKRFAQVGLYVLAIICMVFCLLTVISFVRSSKLRPCERPILYIAICKLIYSLAYLIAYNMGRGRVTCGLDYESNKSIRLQEGMDNSACALTFLMQYFFNSASKLWQFFLILNWIFHMTHKFALRDAHVASEPAAGWLGCLQFFCCLKRSCCCSGNNTTFVTNQNGISLKQKRLYEDASMQRILAKEHIFAWLFPGIACVIVLVTRRVDADELIGICGVGHQHETSFKYLILLPQLIITLTSILLVLYGILLLANKFQLRNIAAGLKESQVIFSQLDSLSIRTLLFFFFLMVPSIFISIGHFKHNVNLTYWRYAQNVVKDVNKPSVVIMNMLENEKPSSEWFILEKFMEYIIGISCGLWTLVMHHELLDHLFRHQNENNTNQTSNSLQSPPYRKNETASTNLSAYAFYEKRNDSQAMSESQTNKEPSLASEATGNYYYSNDKFFAQNPFLGKGTGAKEPIITQMTNLK